VKDSPAKRSASDGVLPEIEQARARGAGALAVGLNEKLAQQIVAIVPAGGTGVVILPTTFAPLNAAGKTAVSATVQGLNGVGATSAGLGAIQHSDDSGATWTTDEAAPLSGNIAAGDAAATTGGTVIYADYPNAGFPAPPGAPRQFRVVVEPVGGNFTTAASQGAMRIQEL
jgi:hypothetical protein